MDGRESARRNAVRNYVDYKNKDLKAHGIYLEEEKLEKLVDKYTIPEWNMQDIMKEIDKEIDQLIENYKKMQQLREEYNEKLEANKEIQDLPYEYSGIEMDKETEELMNIKPSKNPEDLKYSIEEASHIDPTLDEISFTDSQVLNADKEIYRVHQDTQADQNEFQRDSSAVLGKKLDFLEDTGELTRYESQAIRDIVKTSKTTSEMVEKIKATFPGDKAKEIYEIIKEDTPIKETGIEETIEEDYEDPIEKEDEEKDAGDKQGDLDSMLNDDSDMKEVENAISNENEKPKQFIKYNNTEGSAGVLSIFSTIIIAIITIIGFVLMTMLIK